MGNEETNVGNRWHRASASGAVDLGFLTSWVNSITLRFLPTASLRPQLLSFLEGALGHALSFCGGHHAMHFPFLTLLFCEKKALLPSD